MIKTSVFHNGGANAVQELAYGLSTAVQYLLEGQKQGLSVESIADKMVFSFSIDSNYFMNIAKLRAARRLWAGLSAAFAANPEHFKMRIHAVTSEVTETFMINMLIFFVQQIRHLQLQLVEFNTCKLIHLIMHLESGMIFLKELP